MLNENDIINYPSPNYSQGRSGNEVRFITFHHAVGSALSAVQSFSNPARQTSAHFVVAPDKVYCAVNTDDTAWTNGDWNSNCQSVTIEHEGNWQNGFWNEDTINQSARLVALIRTWYPNAVPNRHRDIVATACPCDLPVEEIWNRASQILNPPKPTPPPTPPPVVPPVTPTPALKIEDITNKKMVTNKKCSLWDLTFTTWANARAVKELPKGTEIDISATAKHPLGGVYYLTEYSFSKGIMNGINAVDLSDIPPPEPPVVPPPIVLPPEPPKPPVEPPKPPQTDIDVENNTLLKKILALLQTLVDKITSIFK